ncbi:MAG: rhomboid family intramembrane serine protease [Nevskiales bacterium]
MTDPVHSPQVPSAITKTVAPWMDDSNFPTRVEGSLYGYRQGYRRGSTNPCSAQKLDEALRNDTWHMISLVWTPERLRLLPPIEFPSLHAVCKVRAISTAKRVLFYTTLIVGLAILGMVLPVLLFDLDWTRLDKTNLAIFCLSLTAVLGLFAITAYDFDQARRFSPAYVAQQVTSARYGFWLLCQKSHWRYILPLSLILIWVLQIYTPDISSLQAAGLAKEAVRNGEWWRLTTAPFIHGNTLHVTMNALMFYVCAWQVEVMAPRGSVPFITLAGFLLGGMFSVLFNPVDSVGASGGAFALVGFLATFGWRFRTVLPRNFASFIFVNVGLMFFYGLLMPQIDNATHMGGLIAGLVIGFLTTGRMQTEFSTLLPLLGRLSAGVFVLALIAVFARHWYLV